MSHTPRPPESGPGRSPMSPMSPTTQTTPTGPTGPTGPTVDEALRSLQPLRASEGFTRRVVGAAAAAENGMSGVRGVRRSPRLQAQRLWLFGALAGAAIAIGVLVGSRAQPGKDLAAERASMRQEYDQLVNELDSLRSMARATTPVLYLGSGEELDFVLDLSRMVEEPDGATQPASLQGSQEIYYY